MRPPSREALFTAKFAGQLAGVAMVLCLMGAFGIFLGRSAFFPLQLLAGLVLGEEALRQSGPRTMLVGLLAHQLGPSLLWSKLFGLAVGYLRGPPSLLTSIGIGLAVGLVALILDVYVLLPPVQQLMHGVNVWAEHVPRGWAWAGHLVYGGALGAAFALLPGGGRRG